MSVTDLMTKAAVATLGAHRASHPNQVLGASLMQALPAMLEAAFAASVPPGEALEDVRADLAAMGWEIDSVMRIPGDPERWSACGSRPLPNTLTRHRFVSSEGTTILGALVSLRDLIRDRKRTEGVGE